MDRLLFFFKVYWQNKTNNMRIKILKTFTEFLLKISKTKSTKYKKDWITSKLKWNQCLLLAICKQMFIRLYWTGWKKSERRGKLIELKLDQITPWKNWDYFYLTMRKKNRSRNFKSYKIREIMIKIYKMTMNELLTKFLYVVFIIGIEIYIPN